MPHGRRLLATLSSLPAASARSGASALVPPYAHSSANTTNTPAPSSASLRAPYSHSLDAPSKPNKALDAPYRYTLPVSSPRSGLASASGSASTSTAGLGPLDTPHVQAQSERWLVWARSLLESDRQGEVIAAWTRTLDALASAAAEQEQAPVVPEVGFQGLAAYLASSAGVEAVKAAGSLIVRDVVPDEQALEWARSVALSMRERGGQRECRVLGNAKRSSC
jgi:hypothetical protein